MVVLGSLLGFGRRSKLRSAPKLCEPSAAVVLVPAKQHGARGVAELIDQCCSEIVGAASGFATAAGKALQTTLGALHANQNEVPISSALATRALTDSCGRDFLKPGSWYQNPYMSLWNSSSNPVSSVLHVYSIDEFELSVTQLDSKGGGSNGWVTLRSSFDVEPIPGKPNRMRLNLRHNKAAEILEYDELLFDRGANFMLSMMRRATFLLLSAFCLEVDIDEHVIYCGPRAGTVQKFWQTPVGLSLTKKDLLWSFDARAAQYSGDLGKSLIYG